jgi:hypothetical protein
MNTSINNPNIKVPILRDITPVLNKLLEDGYKASFKAVESGLQCLDTDKIYKPSELLVVNYYRFEGISDPSDNSILYAIQASDGTKGTLLDAYGAYSDPLVEKLMKQVKIEEKD